MTDNREAYSKGYEDGKNAILRMIKFILDDAPNKGYNTAPSYYKISLNTLLEVYEYGKEENKEVN